MIRVLALVALFSASACIIVPARPYRAHRSAVRSGRVCKPSHYWDGSMCRHKGTGKGARKHDYVP
jgi:hypothetical protein